MLSRSEELVQEWLELQRPAAGAAIGRFERLKREERERAEAEQKRKEEAERVREQVRVRSHVSIFLSSFYLYFRSNFFRYTENENHEWHKRASLCASFIGILVLWFERRESQIKHSSLLARRSRSGSARSPRSRSRCASATGTTCSCSRRTGG